MLQKNNYCIDKGSLRLYIMFISNTQQINKQTTIIFPPMTPRRNRGGWRSGRGEGQDFYENKKGKK